MNEISIKTIPPVIATSTSRDRSTHHSPGGRSLLDQILARLKKSLNGYRIPRAKTPAHRIFREENLLDRKLGPEIQRALR